MVELLCFAPDFKLDKATVQFLILSSNDHVYNVSSIAWYGSTHYCLLVPNLPELIL